MPIKSPCDSHAVRVLGDQEARRVNDVPNVLWEDALPVEHLGNRLHLVEVARRVRLQIDDVDRTDLEKLYASTVLASIDSAGNPLGFAAVDLNTGYFLELYVRRGMRRQGHGKQLIEAVKEAARQHGCARIELTVGNDNGNAINQYYKAGFSLRDYFTKYSIFECAL